MAGDTRRAAVPAVACPVLVVHRDASMTGAANARYLAAQLPTARYVQLPGTIVPTAPEATVLAGVVDGFLRGESGESD